MPSAGRPRALDETKQREICALVSAGCTIRQAARYVRCGHATIDREIQRDRRFRRRLEKARLARDVKPLRALELAATKHWRAAAWMLERSHPERYGRRDPRAFPPRQARKLLQNLYDIVDAEVSDPLVHARLDQRIGDAVEQAIPGTRTGRFRRGDLRRSMQFLDALRAREIKEEAPIEAEHESQLRPPPNPDDEGSSSLADAMRMLVGGIRQQLAERSGTPNGSPPNDPQHEPSEPIVRPETESKPQNPPNIEARRGAESP